MPSQVLWSRLLEEILHRAKAPTGLYEEILSLRLCRKKVPCSSGTHPTAYKNAILSVQQAKSLWTQEETRSSTVTATASRTQSKSHYTSINKSVNIFLLSIANWGRHCNQFPGLLTLDNVNEMIAIGKKGNKRHREAESYVSAIKFI